MASQLDRARTKFVLDEKDIPTKWYNIQADFKTPAPPVLHPGTKQPIGPADLAPLFPMELIKQEVSRERWIEIPDEVRDVLRLWRPSPLYRARRLEKALGTPAHIYYKYEGVSPAGSHQPRHAVGQEGPRAGSQLPGLARHRHQRGRRGRRHARRHEVLAGQCAQPRVDAPDGDRARGQEAAGKGGRRGRHRDRLRGRRL